MSIAVDVASVGNPAGLIGKAALKGLEGVNKIAPKDDAASKPRDGYGKKLRESGRATDEGGIVIRPPGIGGPKYAKAIRRDVDDSDDQVSGGCFFPTRSRKTVTIHKGESAQGGVLSIVAFDSNYSDNAGAYEIKFTITRECSV